MSCYQYDVRTKNVIIRRLDDGLPEILHKGDKEWRLIYAGGEDDLYARAVKFGEGCWEDLKIITEDEALRIIESWNN